MKTHINNLSQLFENRDTEKIYYGLVHGNILPAQGKIEVALIRHSSGNKMFADNREAFSYRI